MYYALIVVVIIGVVVYACLKKKRGDIEKPRGEEKPDDGGNHTEIIVKVPTESKGYIVKDGIKKEVTIKYMPQGLQVFDEKGICILNITERLTRCIGSINISGTHGEVRLSGISSADFWFACTNIKIDGYTSPAQKELMVPGITYKNGVLHWDINVLGDGKSFSATVLYGTY